MYEFIKIFNSFVREQAFSNPFEYLVNNKIVAILLFSILGSKLLKEIAFTMCGIFTKRRAMKH